MKMRLTPDKDAFLVKQMELYNEYELISHSKLADCTMFIVDMVYRPMHLHKELELCVVLSGSCRVSTDRQSFEAGPGEILLFDAGSSHELCASGAPARLLTLQISNSFCARFYPQIRSIRFGCRGLSSCLGPEQLPALRRAMLLALSNYLRDTPEAPFACMAQINAIFAILLGGTPYRVLSDTENMTQTRNAERMHRILHYLETHYSEPVRLSEIAEREGLTQTYLSHLFREQLHIPFQDYLGRLRLEAAMLLLRQSDTTLTDAAYACGFSDPKYLNRSFQKNLGMSPRQWLLETAGPEPGHVRRGPAYSAAHPDARRVPGAAGCAGCRLNFQDLQLFAAGIGLFHDALDVHGVGRRHDEGLIVENGVREALDLAGVHIAEVAGNLDAHIVGVGLLGGIGDIFVNEHGVQLAAVDLADHRVAQQTALRAEKFNAPLGGFVRDIEVGLHNALCAVFHAHEDGGRVLHVILRFGEGDFFIHGRDLGHAHTGDVLHQVDGMNRQIHHRAAAGLGLALPPVAGLVREPERKL